MGADCGIISIRISGLAIIVKIGEEEDKRMMLRNKNRLKRENVFTENDLT